MHVLTVVHGCMHGRETKRDIVMMTNNLFSDGLVPYMLNSHNCCEYGINTHSHIYVVLPEAASDVEGIVMRQTVLHLPLWLERLM